MANNGFLSLPIELRTQIYGWVLISASEIKILTPYCEDKQQLVPARSGGVPPEHDRIYTAILRTCKAIHDEAYTILYSQNQFTLVQLSHSVGEEVAGFLNHIGHKNARVLRNIKMNITIRKGCFTGMYGNHVSPGDHHCFHDEPQIVRESQVALELLRQYCGGLTALTVNVTLFLFQSQPFDVFAIGGAVRNISLIKAVPNLKSLRVRILNIILLPYS